MHGTSTWWFGGDSPTQIPHGVGQGNGAAPAIWAVVSTPILNMLREAGFGVKIRSSLSQTPTHFAAYVFVDDSDQCETALHSDISTQDLMAQMQSSLNMWEGGLRASGGALVSKTSHWYLIKFLWDSDGCMWYATCQDEPATLSVQGADGQTTLLTRLEPSDACQTLGVRLALDGNNKAEFQFCLDQAKLWSDALCTGCLPCPLAWLSMTTSIL